MTMSCEKQVNDFDPESIETTAKEWLDIVENCGRTSGLSEDQLYCFVRGKLQGTAKVWLKRSKVSSWQEFSDAFLNAFPANEFNSRKAQRRTLERRKILPNETLENYTEEMVRLGKRFKLPEEVTVSYIVAGLEDPVLSKAIPFGTSLKQLKNALLWQKKLDVLMHQYNEAKVTLDDFEKLADRMEDIVLGSDNLTETLPGNPQVLETIGKELSALLRRHRVALSCSLSDLGTSKTHRIVVHLKTPAVSSDAGKHTKLHVKNQLLQSCLISHLSCDVIQKTSSTTSPSMWYHPLHLFDAQCIVLDLSQLNGAVHREPPNYLHPEPLVPALAAFRYFTTLDFDAGHLQIPLEQDSSRHYFTFTTPLGTFQLQRAPKHFTNTTTIFNKILIELARKLPTGDVVVLNDTLVLPCRDTAEGLAQLSRVLAALAAFGLTAILPRCRFFETQMQLHNWTVQQGKVGSIGLPFRLPVNRGHRLVLVVSECSDGKTFDSWLRIEQGSSETVGRFGEQRRRQDDENDKNVRLAKQVTHSIEHFRQFLLFVPFEVSLEVDVEVEGVFKRQLLHVQQFDFELKVKNKGAS